MRRQISDVLAVADLPALIFVSADVGNRLFDFQTAAVKIAAHHLNKRVGVLIGDVVGLGKMLMATAVARIFEDDYFLETLIICPKNLVKMWGGIAISIACGQGCFRSAGCCRSCPNCDANVWWCWMSAWPSWSWRCVKRIACA